VPGVPWYNDIMTSTHTTDPILTQMASELRAALEARGLDPKNPPAGGPPAAAAFAEYEKRGGAGFTDPDAFARALVAEVGA
jgi:hypothetical protein